MTSYSILHMTIKLQNNAPTPSSSGVGLGGFGLSNPGVGAVVLSVPAWTRGRRTKMSFMVGG